MSKIKRLFTSKTFWLCVLSFFLGGISNPKIITITRHVDVPVERVIEVTALPLPTSTPSITPTAAAQTIRQPNRTQTPAAPKTGITMEKYLAVKEGMTYNEVVSILGVNGQETVRSSFGGEEMVMYQWVVGSGGASMNATFHNNRLTAKGQFGLR